MLNVKPENGVLQRTLAVNILLPIIYFVYIFICI